MFAGNRSPRCPAAQLVTGGTKSVPSRHGRPLNGTFSEEPNSIAQVRSVGEVDVLAVDRTEANDPERTSKMLTHLAEREPR
jgi:hypothetical protein